jgi:hypothetical protein
MKLSRKIGKMGVFGVKASKASVDYGRGMLHSHCGKALEGDQGSCRYYHGHNAHEGSCEKVEGSIRAVDWCRLYAKALSREKEGSPTLAPIRHSRVKTFGILLFFAFVIIVGGFFIDEQCSFWGGRYGCKSLTRMTIERLRDGNPEVAGKRVLRRMIELASPANWH